MFLSINTLKTEHLLRLPPWACDLCMHCAPGSVLFRPSNHQSSNWLLWLVIISSLLHHGIVGRTWSGSEEIRPVPATRQLWFIFATICVIELLREWAGSRPFMLGLLVFRIGSLRMYIYVRTEGFFSDSFSLVSYFSPQWRCLAAIIPVPKSCQHISI